MRNTWEWEVSLIEGMTWDWSGCLFFVEYSVWLAGVRSDEVLFSDIAWKVNLVRSISQLSANRLKLREQTFTRKWSKKGVPPSHLLVKLTEQRFVRLRLHRNQRVLKFQVSVSLFSSFQMRLQKITHTHAKSLSNYASVQRFRYRWIFNHSVDLFKLFTTNWLGSLLERQDLILSLVLDLDGVSETNPSYARMKSDCDRSDFCEWWLPKHVICDLFQKARFLNLNVSLSDGLRHSGKLLNSYLMQQFCRKVRPLATKILVKQKRKTKINKKHENEFDLKQDWDDSTF